MDRDATNLPARSNPPDRSAPPPDCTTASPERATAPPDYAIPPACTTTPPACTPTPPDRATTPPDRTTALLLQVRQAEPGAIDLLFEHLYPDLKRLAAHILNQRARGSRAVSPTTLVHDACQRLLAGHGLQTESRRHFLRLFCRVMDHEWVDRIRHDRAQKRGGLRQPERLADLPADPPAEAADPDSFLDLREALGELAQVDPDAAEVIQLHFFCSATLREIAELTGVTLAGVRSNWEYGRTWLRERLTRGLPRDETAALGG